MRNYYDGPGVEYASVGSPHVEGWRSLSRKTGIKVEAVAGLGLTDNLSCLFGVDGRLRDGAELHSLEAAETLGRGPTPEQRQLEVMDKRWPKKPMTPQQQQVELTRLKGQWFTEFS